MLTLQLITAGRYGIFGDELYYIACSKHLAFGYVDHPPLVALLTLLCRIFFGESLLGLRFMAALAGAVTVLLTAGIARKLGGNKFAQGLSALMVLVSMAFPALFSFLSMNAFDILICTWCVYLLISILNGASPRTWLLFGLVVAIGCLNKYTMLVFAFATVIGLLLTRERRWFASPWPYLGGIIAVLIFLPHII